MKTDRAMRTRVWRLAGAVLIMGVTMNATGAEYKLVVAPDGSGDFTTIKAAIQGVKGPLSEEKQCDIILKSGIYQEQLTTRHWVNIIGEDRDKCVVEYTRKPEETAGYTHVFWATSNTTLKNLTIIGGDVKYCLHSDGAYKYRLVIDNCRLVRKYPEGGAHYRAAFGIGLRDGQHILLKNSVIEADLPIYFHNAGRQKGPAVIEIENCALKGKENTIMLMCLGSGQADEARINHCRFSCSGAAVVYLNRQAQFKTEGWNDIKITGTGNRLDGGEKKPILIYNDQKELVAEIGLKK